MSEKPYDLEQRLMEFAASIVRVVDRLPRTKAGNHVRGQLLRSGTSPLLNHGEAQAAESKGDFIHKMKICLKELRESHRTLRLIQLASLTHPSEDIGALEKENDELIRIFVASIRTASSNSD